MLMQRSLINRSLSPERSIRMRLVTVDHSDPKNSEKQNGEKTNDIAKG